GHGLLQPRPDRHEDARDGARPRALAEGERHTAPHDPLVRLSRLLWQPPHRRHRAPGLQGQGERQDRRRRPRLRGRPRRPRSPSGRADPRGPAVRRAAGGPGAPRPLLPAPGTRGGGRGVSAFAYPVALDLTGRPCLVVGGARVTVVSPSLSPELMRLATDGRFTWWPHAYAEGDVAGFFLIMVATDD